MKIEVQPGKKSYFFEKGYIDLYNTIQGAFRRNGESISKYSENISNLKEDNHGMIKRIFYLVLNVLAVIAVSVVGTVITLGISAANVIILLVFMLVVYVGFSIIWLVDRVYLMKKKIFTACHECKEKMLIPTYICPNCGAKHTNLTPGVYGILNRTCTGNKDGERCNQKLPTTFFNGRRNLEAICKTCSTPLMGREAVPICIPVVGGRSVGKTAFITAFSKEFMDKVAPPRQWEIEFYNEQKEAIYREIEKDFKVGSTRMTERSNDQNKASSTSFSFFIKGKEFKPERLVHIYDIAGEVFTDNNENEVQKQYEYCQGMVLIIDPFAIPSIRYRYEDKLTPQDVAGIGKADINQITDSFLNKLREVTGLSERRMSTVPLAVIIGKVDSANLESEVGSIAVNKIMSEKPEVFTDYYDTQDYICKEFLKENGMESFVNSIDIKFKNNRYFACSAIGHTRDAGQYNPKGILPPMQWIFSKSDKNIAKSWNDIIFTKKVNIKQEAN